MIYELKFIVKVIQKEILDATQVRNLPYVYGCKVPWSIHNDSINNTSQHFTTTLNISACQCLFNVIDIISHGTTNIGNIIVSDFEKAVPEVSGCRP